MKKIAVLGFAFKEGTGDTRESCAIDLVRGFLSEGASVSIYDPCVKESQIIQDLGAGFVDFHSGSLKICQSGEEACEGAHTVVIATKWDIFKVKHSLSASSNCSTLANGVHSNFMSRIFSIEPIKTVEGQMVTLGFKKWKVICFFQLHQGQSSITTVTK
jgi:UDP-N-acetyl-D-mannosaminuronate dehydrogenase